MMEVRYVSLRGGRGEENGFGCYKKGRKGELEKMEVKGNCWLREWMRWSV